MAQRIRSRNQLRGKDGRWVFMGGSVKWFDPNSNSMVSGKILEINGDDVVVENADGAIVHLTKEDVTAINSKADIDDDDEDVTGIDAFKDLPTGQEISVSIDGVVTHFKKTATDLWVSSEDDMGLEFKDDDFIFAVEDGKVKAKKRKPVVASAAEEESETDFYLILSEDGESVTGILKDEPEGLFVRENDEWVSLDSPENVPVGEETQVSGDAVSVFDANSGEIPVEKTLFDTFIVE